MERLSSNERIKTGRNCVNPPLPHQSLAQRSPSAQVPTQCVLFVLVILLRVHLTATSHMIQGATQ